MARQQRRRRGRWSRLLLALLMPVVLSAACGGDDDPDQDASGPTTTFDVEVDDTTTTTEEATTTTLSEADRFRRLAVDLMTARNDLYQNPPADPAAALAEVIDPQCSCFQAELDAIADLAAGRDGPLGTEADARVRSERPGYAEFGDRKFRACSPAMYASLATEMFSLADRLPALSSLDVPTLVIVGEQDEPFLGPCRRLASTITSARLVVVPGAGHSPQFEAPEAWWDALETFLGQVAPSR